MNTYIDSNFKSSNNSDNNIVANNDCDVVSSVDNMQIIYKPSSFEEKIQTTMLQQQEEKQHQQLYQPSEEPAYHQDICPSSFDKNKCNKCGRYYRHRNNLYVHQRFECGKEPQFKCEFCNYRAKLKGNLKKHVIGVHQIQIQ